jgi:succinoglycan biosynthesis protein ExoO
MTYDITYIVAAYNAEKTVERAISSALAQTGTEVQVVVADDCSTDRTGEIVKAMERADRRVRYINLARNSGPAAARNCAIGQAEGRWIGILDADDTLEPSRSANLLARQDGAAAIIDNLVVHTPQGEHLLHETRLLADMRRLELPYFIDHNMLFSGRFNLGYVKPVVLRSFLVEQGIAYNEQVRIGEDYLFLALILARGGVCVVEPSAGYRYTSAAGSISQVLTRGHVEAMLHGDAAFVETVKMDGEALKAQRRRTQNLKRASAYLRIVDQLKERKLSAAIRDMVLNPQAAWHLHMPVRVRIAALMTAFQSLSSATRRLWK